MQPIKSLFAISTNLLLTRMDTHPPKYATFPCLGMRVKGCMQKQGGYPTGREKKERKASFQGSAVDSEELGGHLTGEVADQLVMR